MKRSGIINGALASRCAMLGHTDLVAVADCGLPVPPGVFVVDLALVQGVVGFVATLDALVQELVIERHIYALEAVGTEAEQWIAEHASHLGTADVVSHEVLKSRLSGCALIVRTGEAKPSANVILQCGVSFS